MGAISLFHYNHNTAPSQNTPTALLRILLDNVPHCNIISARSLRLDKVFYIKRPSRVSSYQKPICIARRATSKQTIRFFPITTPAQHTTTASHVCALQVKQIGFLPHRLQGRHDTVWQSYSRLLIRNSHFAILPSPVVKTYAPVQNSPFPLPIRRDRRRRKGYSEALHDTQLEGSSDPYTQDAYGLVEQRITANPHETPT